MGTFALVVVLSAFNGLEGLVESLFESFDADVQITAQKGKTFKSSEIDFSQIEELEDVQNYTRVIEEVCGIKYQDNQSIATAKGVEESFLEMSDLENLMFVGNATLKENNANYAILGYGVAHTLALYLNNPFDYHAFLS